MSLSPSPTRQPDLRIAEVVAALSLATDLGTGHPIEHSLRACLLAVHLGDALGLSEDELRVVYYVALLRWSGCTADSHRADLFGDEIALGPQIDSVELWQPLEMLQFMMQTIGHGLPPAQRAWSVAGALASGIRRSAEAAVAHCEVAQQIAARLGLGAPVVVALGQIFERWDGRGVPGHAKGEAIALAVRIVHIAMDAELFHRLGGADAVLSVVRKRAGGFYDPLVAECFCREAPRLLALLNTESVWSTTLEAEPGVQLRLRDEQFEPVLIALADFTDLRSAYTRGHSRAVADLAAAASQRIGLTESERESVWQAGLLHEIGMAGISISITEKPGPLSDSDWERIRLHPYYAERILARPRPLAQLGALAALHHERVDGSGYHRALPAPGIPPPARLLAAADVYRALIEERPHRPAYHSDQAATLLRAEVHAGRLDGDAVAAVLDAAGHRVARARREYVAGLSERELEVLRLLARGLSKRRIAERLVISERTADHHVRHIYTKIGVSTRAGAAMFAMQHQLISDPSEE